jgi:hypothetical protein
VFRIIRSAAQTAEAAGEVAGEAVVGAAVGLVVLVASIVLGGVSDTPLKPSASDDDPDPNAPPRPDPNPVQQCHVDPSRDPDECTELLQGIRDAIDRNKRDFNNKGIHGLQHRRQELITGPCGPNDEPFRYNSRGEYKRTKVWQNHVDEFNRTKNALRNRFIKAVDRGCTIPDDLLKDAADAEKMEAPTSDEWRGDPNRPCVDSPLRDPP